MVTPKYTRIESLEEVVPFRKLNSDSQHLHQYSKENFHEGFVTIRILYEKCITPKV